MNPIADLTLSDYLRIIRKRKEIIILCFLLITTTVWLYASQLEKKIVPIYQATATVKIEQRRPVSAALTELVSWGMGDIMSTELEMVKSYAVMELVAYRLGLIKKEELKYDHLIDGEEVKQPEGKKLPDEVIRKVRRLRNRVSASQKEDTNLVEITVTSTNPEEAKRIANTVAEEYRNENAYQKRRNVLSTKKEIEAGLNKYKTELKKAEQEEKQFREEHGFVTPDKNQEIVLAQISSLKVEQTNIQRQIEQEKDKLKQLQEAKGDTAKLKVLFPEIYNHPTLSTARRNIENLEDRLTEFLESATEKHPQAKGMKQTLLKLKSELNSNLQKLINDTIISVEAKIAGLKEDLQKVENEVEKYKKRLSAIPEEVAEYRTLQNKIENNTAMLAMLKKRYEDIKITESERIVSDVTLIEPAIMPTTPINAGGNKIAKVLAGGVVGLLVGFVLAFLVENLDTSIGTIEDLEGYLKTSVLGVIPNISLDESTTVSFKQRLSSLRLPSWLNPFRPKWIMPPQGPPIRLIVQDNPKAPEAEAFRALRTNILLRANILMKGENDGSMALLVTSASPQEGKSAVVSNLALAMAQLRKTTLLVDCDLRRPDIHKTFGLEREPGLTDLIMGSVTLDEAVKSATDLLFGTLQKDFEEVPGIDYLHVLPAGSRMPNPSEILAFDEVTALINQLKTQYDIILLDTAPALPVTDALVLASKVDSVLLVYRAGRSNRRIPKRAMEVIDKNAEGKILGVVLNDVKPEIRTMTTTYPYYYYYKSEGEDRMRNE